MKKSCQFIIVICLLIFNRTFGQELSPVEVQKLADVLNTTMSKKIQLTFEKNHATFEWEGVSKTLDLRNDSEIKKDSMSKIKSPLKFKPKGRYLGPIFWKYRFKSAKNKEASFRANKSGQLFFKLQFQEQDTININSQLNAYSCVQRTTDSAPHSVQWSGDKYISVLLHPERINDAIRFRVNGITISGKFQRKDKWEINKNYTKGLRTYLKREFKQLFSELIFVKSTDKSYQVVN